MYLRPRIFAKSGINETKQKKLNAWVTPTYIIPSFGCTPNFFNMLIFRGFTN
ncbi:hypothetical protein Hanom_Chr05g00468051 [Helianthus anomalus]